MLINEPINLDAEFERVNGKERLVTNFNAVDSIANTEGKVQYLLKMEYFPLESLVT